MVLHDHAVKETLLRVSNVSVAYGDTPILKDLSLEVRNIIRPGLTQGQVVGLLGPSGVGKTTLFRVLAGLMQPDTGTVEVKGEPVRRGMVGVVAQDYPLFEHRSVLSNLTVAGRQAGLSGAQADEKARGILERFELAEHGGKYPVQLSGGQRQRVAIAQQFMCSDYFLLMDEPFSGLDPVAVGKVEQFITEVAASDELKTIIVVTHDIAAAIEVSDTLWILGRDRDASGKIIPGAKVQATYNLIERGIAWRDHVTSTPESVALLQEIRNLFPRL